MRGVGMKVYGVIGIVFILVFNGFTFSQASPQVEKGSVISPPMEKVKTTEIPLPDWMPGDPFDQYAEVKCNFIKNVKTGATRPCKSPPPLDPNEKEAINISVVIKPGVTETINQARINVTAWFAAKPNEPKFGEYIMIKYGDKEAKREIPNLLQCTKVYFTVKVWDSANRMIQSNNSLAAKDLQNYTVTGACNWPSGATFQSEINITQNPYSADIWEPLPPSPVSPGPNMSALTDVVINISSMHFIQMPWVVLYFNQTTYDGKMNSTYTTAVRGHCLDQYSPNACDKSDEDLMKANGTSYEFYIPGFLAGMNIEYSIVAVDYRVYDYSNDPEYKQFPWKYIMERKFCQKVPEACLMSPNYYYYIPTKPPPIKRYAGAIVVQLLKKVISVSGKEQLDYIRSGCVQFSNDTIDPKTNKPWTSQIIPTDEWGVAVSPPFVVNISSNFTIKAWAPCQSSNMQVAHIRIPNADGPNGTVNNLVIIIFTESKDINYPWTTVGWVGDDYAIVYTIGCFGFFAPLMFFALRFFRTREEAERRKRQEAEQRFKI